MCQSDNPEPIDDDELLYRRIPVSLGYYSPGESPNPSPQAFNPRDYDTTGLSLDRAKYRQIEEAAAGSSPQGYYVAILRAGDLRASGILIVPQPVEGNPGHAEIPGLTYQDRKTDRYKEWMVRLAQELTIEVRGPFLRRT